MKKIYLLICIMAFSLSCSESFLEEELVSTQTADYYKTPQGLDELLNASYNGLRWRFNGEHGFSLTNYGVDEITVGNGPDMIEYNDYNSNLMAFEGNKLSDAFWGVTIAWRELWHVIKLCNTGIGLSKTVTGEPFHTEALRNNAEAQFLFLRAFYYFDMVQQWGSMPLIAEYSIGIVTEAPKSSVEDIYKQIISDFRAAIPNLNNAETGSRFGRITKGAAEHFLAKAYLTRGSEVNRSWNSNYNSDLDSAIYFAEEVLAKKGPMYDLEPDFATLFNYTEPDGANEKSKEIILTAQFTSNLVALGDPSSYYKGNKMHLYVGTWYEDMPGMTRDIANDRPWRRLMPTDYGYDVFDHKNDSRFFKSFKFAYLCNRESSIPKWTAAQLLSAFTNTDTITISGTKRRWAVPEGKIDTIWDNTNKFELGDTALVFIANSETNPIDTAIIAQWRYRAFVRYVKGKNGDIKKMMPDNIKNHFAPISKYFDHTRLSVAQEEGYRDGILARFAETYLIAAEAYGRRGNYDKAMEYINTLRQRAAYKDGEVKQPIYYMVEDNNPTNPGTVTEMLISNISELTTIPSDPIQSKYFPSSANTPEKIFLCHILNERSRELICELVRWQDLVRTKTLIERATLYNGTALPLEGKHELRPFPQPFIDGLQENGAPLTDAKKVAYQNPGY